jgi:hypothetical protein
MTCPHSTPIRGETVYAALRCTEGRLWIDSNSVGLVREHTQRHVEEIHRQIPSWDAVNPCLRIIRCLLVADEPDDDAQAVCP